MRPKRISLLLSLLLLSLILMNGCGTLTGAMIDHSIANGLPEKPEVETIPLDSLQLLKEGDRLLLELTSGDHLNGLYQGMDNDTTFVFRHSSEGGARFITVGLRPWQIVSIQRYVQQPNQGFPFGVGTKIGMTLDALLFATWLFFQLTFPDGIYPAN